MTHEKPLALDDLHVVGAMRAAPRRLRVVLRFATQFESRKLPIEGDENCESEFATAP